MVLSHLRKYRFPRGEYNKLKMKKIGPCGILRKFLANAYELELPMGIGISHIFNVADLYPYQVNDEGAPTTSGSISFLIVSTISAQILLKFLMNF